MCSATMPTFWQQLVDAGIALLLGEDEAEPKSKPPQRAKPANERTIHRVRQRYMTDCGIAATAMLARVPYAKAKAALFPDGSHQRSYGTYTRDVLRALDHFGVRHGKRERKVEAWEDIPSTALVTARHSSTPEQLHWLIFQRRSAGDWLIIDPASPDSQTLRLSSRDYKEFTPLRYVTVDPISPSQSPKKKVVVRKAAPKKAAKTPSKKNARKSRSKAATAASSRRSSQRTSP